MFKIQIYLIKEYALSGLMSPRFIGKTHANNTINTNAETKIRTENTTISVVL